MTRLFRLLAFFTLFCAAWVVRTGLVAAAGEEAQAPAEEARPDAELLRSAYSGGETMRYQVDWLGLTAGELVMEVGRQEVEGGPLMIKVTVRSAGILAAFYPVEDTFFTRINGTSRLPEHYELIQQEGRRRKRGITEYDQGAGRIRYTKNDDPPQLFEVEGPVHNEFSSFLFLRVMRYEPGHRSVVPTFADRKRHRVEVSLEGRESAETLFGAKRLLAVRPHLDFKGLYRKAGDPLIWLTDDPVRIPVKIKASIVIGSLTATLVEYRGPSICVVQRPK